MLGYSMTLPEVGRGKLKTFGDKAMTTEKTFKKEFDLKRGDRVAITIDYVRYVGKIISVDHYERYGWFIEIDKDIGGYGYWKQGCDGGTIEKL